MEDKQSQKNVFVREQIKDKPRSKKRLLMRLAYAALCGVVFAASASIVLCFVLPKIIKNNLPAPEVVIDDTQALEVEFDTSEEQEETENEDVATEETEATEILADVPEDATEFFFEYSLSIEDYQELQDKLYAIGKELNRSIVTITSVVNDTDIFHNPYEMEGQGAGVIIAENDSEVLVLTEKKNIHGAKKLSVTFIDESMSEAQIKMQDNNTGLAVLSVTKAELTKSTRDAIGIAPIGNSARVKNGTMVIALGSPLGTNYSILTGNITSTENEVTTEDHNYSLFTTDILGSKDGSGILINVQGEIIGIIMQSYNTKSATNTLTAVAVTDVVPVLSMLCEGKEIPYIGLRVSTVTDKVARAYDIPKGVYIREVTLDSPAMNAGLQSGDVIIQMNGEPVTMAAGYSAKLLTATPGEDVVIMVERKGANGYSEISYTVKAGVLK